MFRKKTILDAENDSNSETDDEQEDVSGEVLRQEVCSFDLSFAILANRVYFRS